ncbi:uncharacterized protein LOC118165344 [Oxyura jamaicensis]|uniref:uncharacterized protein LOC118165344 n=1 Tax=Oxyura jamaicensis TaxID=8884 RepID=UPI0015A699CA|nr:uncharacterized protein LOC118165344 [Oxyura jamaicensis]
MQKHAGELGTPGWGRGEHSREVSATRTEPGEMLEGSLLKTGQLSLQGYFQRGVRLQGALCCSPPPHHTSSGLSPLCATKGGTRRAFGLAESCAQPSGGLVSVFRGAGLWPVVLAAVFYKMLLAPQLNFIVFPNKRCPGDAPSPPLTPSGDTAVCTMLSRGCAQPWDGVRCEQTQPCQSRGTPRAVPIPYASSCSSSPSWCPKSARRPADDICQRDTLQIAASAAASRSREARGAPAPLHEARLAICRSRQPARGTRRCVHAVEAPVSLPPPHFLPVLPPSVWHRPTHTPRATCRRSCWWVLSAVGL